jgi:hypothetical protein
VKKLTSNGTIRVDLIVQLRILIANRYQFDNFKIYYVIVLFLQYCILYIIYLKNSFSFSFTVFKHELYYVIKFCNENVDGGGDPDYDFKKTCKQKSLLFKVKRRTLY